MPTLNFMIRTNRKNNLAPVYVRLRAGRKINIVCKTDIYVKPDNWSNESQQAGQRADVHNFKVGEAQNTGRKNFNDKINGLRTFIETTLEQTNYSDLISMIQEKDPKNLRQKNKKLIDWLETIIDKHWHPEKYEVNLFSFIRQFIDGAETRPNVKTGRPVSYKMRREYEVTFDYLKKYAAEEGKTINFKDIDLPFYEGFTAFLQKKK